MLCLPLYANVEQQGCCAIMAFLVCYIPTEREDMGPEKYIRSKYVLVDSY